MTEFNLFIEAFNKKLQEHNKKQSSIPTTQKVKEMLKPFKNFKVDSLLLKSVNEDIETYIAFSITDIDRGIWIYNDNSLDNKTSGSGRKTLTYKCSLAHLNDIKLKLQVSIRDNDDQMIAFADSANSPVILLNRTDIEDDDKSAKDSATGMVQRNGKWEIKE